MKAAENFLGVLRTYLLLIYVAVFLSSIVVYGIPVDRIAVLLWMLGSFGCASLGRSREQVIQMLRDWALLVIIYMAYDYSRGTADQWGIGVNYTALRDLDSLITFGREPISGMQRRFYTANNVKWYDVVGSIVYMTHFVFPVLPLVLLRLRNRTSWLHYVRRFTLTLGISVFIFIIFPAAPPWMASQKGYLPPIDRITGRGWWELHLKTVSKTLDRGVGVLNAVAPMPSLHAGMALLVALWFSRNCRLWIRIVALAHPIAMLTALVYFGEHYIIDGIAGWAIVLLAWFIANKWEERTALQSLNSRIE
ncbi:MAG: inositol phosphorylceramide synthase [Ilumatobacteraceae bacterium]|nr:inositol phosphorylceramide synthase [Ilumatobacteraceae bacterium]